MSVHPSVCLYVRPSIKISVTTELIGFYLSGNIPTGPVVVLGYFLWGGTPPTPKKQKIPHPLFLGSISCSAVFFFKGR